MWLQALGGGLLIAGLTLPVASTEAATVLFLAREESLLLGMSDGSEPQSPAQSAPLSLITQAGEPLRGFFMANPLQKASPAPAGATLAEHCQRDRLDAIVAVGREPAQAIARECAVPLLVVRASRQQVTPVLADRGRPRRSAIYLEAEPLLNLRLARALLPAARTVGVLAPTPAPAWLAPLRAEAHRLEFTLDEIAVLDDLGAVRGLRPRLAGLDAVLLPPDSTLINEWSLKPLLLMTVRQGVPTFGGLTARYVEAGVTAAVVADEARLGEQMRLFIAELAQGRSPAPAYPTAVRVVVNPTVAQTLGLSAEVVERARSLFPRF
jgi:ABC-type uncharacterized transport system substrate-binding protein